MKCTRVRELLELYAGNDLPPRLQERVSRHLDSCAACQAELVRLQRVLAAGRRCFAPAEEVAAGVRLWPRVRAELARDRQRAQFARARVRLALVGVGLTVLVAGAAFWLRDFAMRSAGESALQPAKKLVSQGAALPVVEGGLEPGTTPLVLHVDDPRMTIVWFLD
ncbi:MAG: anti-sigma factor [bacterium]|jgi:anti-sigma factor RsiW|nr:anti-sigma factor [candidate division KSB1 bacterium]MDH7560412.1 anti-sigma factor [bacterium]